MRLETELRQQTGLSTYRSFTPQNPDQIFLVAGFYVEECGMARAYLILFEPRSVTFADTYGNTFPPVLYGFDASPSPFYEISVSYYEPSDPSAQDFLSTSHSMHIATIIPNPTSAQQFTIQSSLYSTSGSIDEIPSPLSFTATVDAQTSE